MTNYKGVYIIIDGDAGERVVTTNVDGQYKYQKSKSKYPAYHFRLSSRDLALFGQLYLNKGVWNDTPIVPKEWIAVSTKPYSIYTQDKKRYSYGMFWRLKLAENSEEVESFYHTDKSIQLLGVYSDTKMVIIHRVNTEKTYKYDKADLDKTLQLVFDSKIA
jgi:CubicO group peptidase (beta-lactamase class C family)